MREIVKAILYAKGEYEYNRVLNLIFHYWHQGILTMNEMDMLLVLANKLIER